MTTEHARQIAEEIASNIFGAGASETQRLGALACSTIQNLAAQLDARDKISPTPPAAEAAEADAADEPAPKRKGHAKDSAKKGTRKK